MSIDTPLEANIHSFDARGVARRFRHAAIFGALDALHPGETMRFFNDHNPLPLLAQLRDRFGDNLTFNYRQTHPDLTVIDISLVDSSKARDKHAHGDCCGSCG
ncbi:DUF2249 domain-containing protein [Dyella halodurans]|uniref:DUF2249 domain-containing protein n=1 Tax=Dyella halodurans TaxID=1920171 RepID=A0ABV9C7K8_9GAMM|nr:DUF2249 domain-containing protein [Dyella halodurans]